MRDIKFRAWHKECKKMFKIGQITLEKGIWNYEPEDRELIGMSVPYQPSFILMQYTGLKDKNGKEIYEGDIVKIHKHSYDYGFKKDEIGQIKFIDGCFEFYREKTKNKYYFNDLATENRYGKLDYYEVIGNIYDNPDLLEKGAEDE